MNLLVFTYVVKLNDLDSVVSSKVVSVRVMKTFSGKRRVAPLILSVGTRLRLVINITSSPFSPGKNIPEPRVDTRANLDDLEKEKSV
jgi:hypothetical protein